MGYRLALDLGTNSIGWASLNLDEDFKTIGLVDGGVRIFSDGRVPKTGTSLAEARRDARQARRRRDRYLRRRKELMALLIEAGLMPSDEDARKGLELLDPYELRAKGLDNSLTANELGRVLFHLNQRRGFKSNRRTESADETGVIKQATRQMQEKLEVSGARTFGEFLYQRRQAGLPTRIRLTGKGAKAYYEYYPTRQMLENEFEALWQSQAGYHPELTEELKARLFDCIFYQRPLRPIDPGRCTFCPDEHRAPKALPIHQRVRILEELNHLHIISPSLETRPLTLEERNILYKELCSKKQMTFPAMRRKIGLDVESTFSLEGEKRDKLKGDETAAVLSAKKCFGPAWKNFTFEEQNSIVESLLVEEDEEALQIDLQETWGLAPDTAETVAAAKLPTGYGRLGRTALTQILDVLEKDVIPYSEAVARTELGSHSQLLTGEIWGRLPYYGVVLQRHVGTGTGDPADKQEKRLGRISNPTVHIALNQVRRVVNEIIKLYGHPEQVVIEVARELKEGLERRKEREKRQAEAQKSNDSRREKLEQSGIKITADSMLRMRLWEELNPEDAAGRRCPYTGERISFTRLFSDEVEIEHILPFARTLDNSPANKTVSMRSANRFKGNRTPYEAFGSSPEGYDWQGIAARAAHLPKNKVWRFTEEAMQRYDEKGDFIARQLTDTQYLSKLAREYLCYVCNPDQVWVTPGRLTNLLAHRWGFPKKDRDSHLHHFVDACLIGVTDRRILQQVSRRHALDLQQGVERFLADVPEPWEGFRDDVFRKEETIIVSHKADHGVEGCLHNSTAYGFVKHQDSRGQAQHRVPLTSLDSPSSILKIKGGKIAARLLAFMTGLSMKESYAKLETLREAKAKDAKESLNKLVALPKNEYSERLERFVQRSGIRRVRIVENKPLIPIRDVSGHVYKGVQGDSNAFYAIYIGKDGKWTGEIITTFDANKDDKTFAPKLPLVTRLFIGDMLEIDHDGRRIVARVQMLSAKQIALAEHDEANTDSRNRDKANPFKYIYKGSPAALQKAGARPVHITPCGRRIYPEVPEHDSKSSGDSR